MTRATVDGVETAWVFAPHTHTSNPGSPPKWLINSVLTGLCRADSGPCSAVRNQRDNRKKRSKRKRRVQEEIKAVQQMRRTERGKGVNGTASLQWTLYILGRSTIIISPIIIAHWVLVCNARKKPLLLSWCYCLNLSIHEHKQGWCVQTLWGPGGNWTPHFPSRVNASLTLPFASKASRPLQHCMNYNHMINISLALTCTNFLGVIIKLSDGWKKTLWFNLSHRFICCCSCKCKR